MEHIQLFQTLENLKNTLSEIESAKEQVESTIQAYSALQSSISDYADNLQPISEMMNNIVSSLVQRQKAITEQANAIIVSFQNSIQQECTKFSNECNDIHSSLSNKVKEAMSN